MWKDIEIILSAIVLVGAALAALHAWVKPILSLRDTVKEHTEDLERIKRHEVKDLEVLKNVQMMNKAQCNAMLCIINHMIDGNHINKMQETRDDIQELLTKM